MPASGWRTLHAGTTQVPERARCGTAAVRDLRNGFETKPEKPHLDGAEANSDNIE
jgi:hypothetical protein